MSPISEDERRGATQERLRAFKRSTHGESVTFQFIISFLGDTGKVSFATLRQRFQLQPVLRICLLIVFTVGVTSFAEPKLNATTTAGATGDQQEISKTPSPREQTGSPSNLESAEDWNRRLRGRFGSVDPGPSYDPREYVIGPEDVLDINVFEAAEMNRGVRISASGEISLPLLGAVAAAGLTPRELETTLEELLRQKYMKDPHVSVFVRDMQSHPVSVMGAVRKPGVFQIRGKKSLVEILSLAEGLADDAGETVVILRSAGEKNAPEFASVKTNDMAGSSPGMRFRDFDVPGGMDMDPEKVGAISQNVVRVNLKGLLDSTDPRNNPTVYPGDIVKVSRAGIVYVVGAVGRPGGFAMKTNEKVSVLQAIALSEGLTRTASKSGARIIRTDDNGARTETPVDLGKILSGKSPDPMLGSRDILFVPDSMAKTTYSRSVEVAVQTLTGLAIFRW
jgi:polysaccharide biosynthesis/export protein